MAESSGEKKHPASQRKLRRARRQGQVARSRELAGAAAATAVVVSLAWQVPGLVQRLLKFTQSCLSRQPVPAAEPVWSGVLTELTRTLALVGGAGMLAGALVAVAQVGFNFNLRLRLSTIDPVQGMKRMFSASRFVDLALMLLKLVACALLGAALVVPFLLELLAEARELDVLVGATAGILLRLAAVMCLLGLLQGGFDWWLQRRRHLRRMRMNDQELRQENKEQEGDPHIRQERRRQHRQLLQGVGMSSLSRARVVVVNPTHVAVALAYRPEEDEAPWVIVSGWAERARAIKGEAERLGIAVVQQVGLARSLVRLEWGEEVPEESYQAVAEIIRAVESLDRSAGADLPRTRVLQ